MNELVVSDQVPTFLHVHVAIGFWEQMKAHLDMLIPDKRLDKIDIVAHIDPDLLQLASFCITSPILTSLHTSRRI